jgi:hypothetical protein
LSCRESGNEGSDGVVNLTERERRESVLDGFRRAALLKLINNRVYGDGDGQLYVARAGARVVAYRKFIDRSDECDPEGRAPRTTVGEATAASLTFVVNWIAELKK